MFPLSLYCLPLCKANSTSFDATGGMQWTYAMHLATSPAASCKPQPSDRSGSHVINPLVRNTRLFINYGGEIVAKVIYSANDKVIDRSTTAITQCWNYTWGFFYSFTPGSKLPFQQILSTVDFFYLLDCLTITGLDRTYHAHHFVLSFTF